jgi:tRNA nucleotidyltransferase (CCA-adding enzyme)
MPVTSLKIERMKMPKNSKRKGPLEAFENYWRFYPNNDARGPGLRWANRWGKEQQYAYTDHSDLLEEIGKALNLQTTDGDQL